MIFLGKQTADFFTGQFEKTCFTTFQKRRPHIFFPPNEFPGMRCACVCCAIRVFAATRERRREFSFSPFAKRKHSAKEQKSTWALLLTLPRPLPRTKLLHQQTLKRDRTVSLLRTVLRNCIFARIDLPPSSTISKYGKRYDILFPFP